MIKVVIRTWISSCGFLSQVANTLTKLAKVGILQKVFLPVCSSTRVMSLVPRFPEFVSWALGTFRVLGGT